MLKPPQSQRLAYFLLISFCVVFAFAGSTQAGNTVLNGAAKRPFYAFAHNPNVLTDIDTAIANGFNAMEPDITTADCNGVTTLVDKDSDEPFSDGECSDVHLTDWCNYIYIQATTNPNCKVQLIAFDTKHPVADADDDTAAARGLEILNTIRTFLKPSETHIRVLISVGTQGDAEKVFRDLYDKLDPQWEGLQIDADDNPDQVLAFFSAHNYSGIIGYGDGTTAGQGPHVPRALDHGSFLRATTGLPQVVTYAYSLVEIASMDSFIDGGVDGIIPFDAEQLDLINVIANHPEIRLATPADDPFNALKEAYGVEIQTGSSAGDGTDADIEFTLNGCRGSATITVNGGLIHIGLDTGRFKIGNADWITIPTKNLGELQSITIHNIKSLNLNDGWQVDSVKVASFRYLGSNVLATRQYVSAFSHFVDNDSTITIPLQRNFDYLPTIQCPGNISLPNDLNQCGAAATFSPMVDAPCNNGSSVSNPASGSFFPVGTTTVSSYAQSPEGQSDPCTFTVTVQDTQKPVITCPGNQTVNATSPAGATVSFAATATDNCSATTASLPASGATFPIGNTTVNSTATDPAGNHATCSFTVHVKGASEQLNDLVSMTNGLSVSAKTKKDLLSNLNKALNNLKKHEPLCNSLSSFLGQVQKAVQTGKLSISDGNALSVAANQIKAAAGCP